jgi:hypothetical protein
MMYPLEYAWKLLDVADELLELLWEKEKQRKPPEDAADFESTAFWSDEELASCVTRMTISLQTRNATGNPGMSPCTVLSALSIHETSLFTWQRIGLLAAAKTRWSESLPCRTPSTP